MSYGAAKYFRTFLENRIHALEPSPVLETKNYEWHTQVEKYSPQIREELVAILPRLQEVVNFNEVLRNQRALKQGGSWKSFFLTVLGNGVKEHETLCPQTTKALKEIPGVINAFFSILAPGTHIPAHRGPYAGILRYHLGVVIPQGDLGIRVGEEVCRWEEGKSLFFDDSFDHEAWNKTSEIRAILFVDLVRPLPARLSILNRLVLLVFKFSKAAREAEREVLKTAVKSKTRVLSLSQPSS